MGKVTEDVTQNMAKIAAAQSREIHYTDAGPGFHEARNGVLTNVFYIVMRRMRFPLLLIITVFSIAVIGFSLIPGVDADGNPTPPLSVFEAFYVVSFTAMTIGFGEVPNPFSTAQRMWMTLTIYITVSAWSYSLVAVLSLLQDHSFQNAFRFARFTHNIQQLREPFYIVCGGAETGTLVMHGLDHLGMRFVVIEKSPERLAELRLEEFSVDAPMIAADAAEPATIEGAGLQSHFCRGVVALAEDDATNQAIAVTVRLLAKNVPVLARIRSIDTETHMGVFGGDVVINPFERFSEQLVSAISAPQRHQLRNVLTSLPGEPIPELVSPPEGDWIVCGYGRFGQEMTKHLREVGVHVSVIDHAHFAEGGVDVDGTGTTSEDLKKAGIDNAVGIVAANASDTKNLAIAVTARALRKDIFIVTRQNQQANAPLFEAFRNDYPMEPSRLVAQEFLARITTPLLSRFLRFFQQFSETDCATLFSAVSQLDPGRTPEVWDLAVNVRRTPAVVDALKRGKSVRIQEILSDPFNRDVRLSAMVLMVRRGSKNELLPNDDYELQEGDRLLLAGSPSAKRESRHVLRNVNTLDYVTTGRQSSGSSLWRWVDRVRGVPETTPRNPQTVDF